MKINFGILTVSDRCFAGTAIDKSGPALVELLQKQKFESRISAACFVPDEKSQIEAILKDWCDQKHVDVILTTGGTGFAPRDVTPEATLAVLDYEAPGISTAMMKSSLDITPMAMLSRSVCGVRGRTLIVNLPGSPKGAVENATTALIGIPHAVSLIKGDLENVEKVHKKLHCDCSKQSEEAGVVGDITKVAHRPRKSPYPMIEVQIALKSIMDEVERTGVIINDTIFKAIGQISASDSTSLCNIPPYPASIKDGYAVLSSDGAGERQVVGDSLAGGKTRNIVLQPGQCMRITTGAPVCAGADAVVQVEDTELLESSPDGSEELKVKILQAPTVGQDIRPTGSDLQIGEFVVAKNTKIGPAQIGALASAGLDMVKFYAAPKVSVFSTGNEIHDVGSKPGPGVIFDSNRPTIIALLKQQGYSVTDQGIVMDEPDKIEEILFKSFASSNVVISTGGVSMGEKDYLKHILLKMGAKIHFGRVNMKPGKPTTFATFNHEGSKKYMFALPGNPVSATVTCHLFALPALRALAGFSSSASRELTVSVAEKIVLDSRPEYCRAMLEQGKVPSSHFPVAHLTGNQISSRLLSLQSGSVLLELPGKTSDKSVLEKGDLVKALVIDY